MYVFHVLRRLLLFLAILSTVNCVAFPTGLTRAVSQARLQDPSYNIRALIPISRTSLGTASRQSAGLTGDTCDSKDDCAGDRLCWQFEGDDLRLCTAPSGCFCAPRDGGLMRCLELDDCEDGELCSRGDESFPLCFSEDFVRRNGRTVVTSPPGDGYTRDLCRDDSDCKGDRTCRLASDVSQICGGVKFCFCTPPELRDCCPGEECIPEEVCSQNNDAKGTTPFCTSPTNVKLDEDFVRIRCEPSPTPPTTVPPTPTPPPTRTSPPTRKPDPTFDGGVIVCIAIHLLRHLPDSELVYQKHAWGTVLCDTQTSCATPGHIVVYKDKPMMMSSYCKLVGCVKRVMQVNSPRYRRKHRVPSMTDGLEFTVFSARYETSLEQNIMAVAVKMGL